MNRIFAPLLLVPILQLTPVALAKTPDWQREWEECEIAAPEYLHDAEYEIWMESCLDTPPFKRQ